MLEVLICVADGADDVEAMVDLRQQWTREHRGGPRDPGFAERFRRWFATEHRQRTFWLARHGGTAVGMANLLTFERMPGPSIDSGRWGYLGNMYVTAEHRNAGIGGHLLAAVVEHADEHGLERLVLSPSARSVPFYRRAGFDDAHQLLLRPRPD